MKRQNIINSIIACGLLFTGVASASDSQENDTDLIYGNNNVVSDQGEAFVAGPSVQNDQVEDMIYGEQKSIPSRGEAPERFVDNRDSNTDLIYGS